MKRISTPYLDQIIKFIDMNNFPYHCDQFILYWPQWKIDKIEIECIKTANVKLEPGDPIGSSKKIIKGVEIKGYAE